MPSSPVKPLWEAAVGPVRYLKIQGVSLRAAVLCSAAKGLFNHLPRAPAPALLVRSLLHSLSLSFWLLDAFVQVINAATMRQKIGQVTAEVEMAEIRLGTVC